MQSNRKLQLECLGCCEALVRQLRQSEVERGKLLQQLQQAAPVLVLLVVAVTLTLAVAVYVVLLVFVAVADIATLINVAIGLGIVGVVAAAAAAAPACCPLPAAAGAGARGVAVGGAGACAGAEGFAACGGGCSVCEFCSVATEDKNLGLKFGFRIRPSLGCRSCGVSLDNPVNHRGSRKVCSFIWLT